MILNHKNKRSRTKKLNRFTRKEQGAVSVFLVIILVPCIFFASVFVDVGRVSLSRAQATPAAELALNSLMTHYDLDLNDWYGLVASCQDVDQFYETSEQWFLDTMESKEPGFKDYLATTKIDDSSNGISPVDNANLANAAMMKAQIVDFMKYRAPVTAAQDIYTRIKGEGMKKQLDQTKDSEKNQKVVDAKTKYFEAESDLDQACYASYRVLKKNYSDKGYSNKTLEDIAGRYDKYKSAYEEINKRMIMDMYTGQGTRFYQLPTYNANDPDYQGITGDDSKTNDDAINDMLSDLTKQKNSLKSEEIKLAKKWTGLASKGMYDIQYWVQAMSKGGSQIDKVEKAAKEYTKVYLKLSAMTGCEHYNSDVSSGVRENVKNVLNDAKSFIETDHYDVKGTSKDLIRYTRVSTTIAGFLNAEKAKQVEPSKVTIKYDGSDQSIDTVLQSISKSANDDAKLLEDMHKVLDTVISGGQYDDNYTLTSLDDIQTLIGSAHDELVNWESVANGAGTALAEKDLSKDTPGSIPDQKGTITKNTGSLSTNSNGNPRSVSTLKTRLVNMRTQVEELQAALTDITYNGTNVKDISSYSKLKQVASGRIDTSQIVVNKKKLEEYKNETFSNLFLPKTFNFTLKKSDDYNMQLDVKNETKKIPNAYTCWFERFKMYDSNDAITQGSISKKKKDDIDALGKEADKQKKSAFDFSDYKDLPDVKGNANASSGTAKLTDLITGMISSVTDLTSGNYTNIRDNLYTITYMRHMFSYATYENEIKYNQLCGSTNLTLGNYQATYDGKNCGIGDTDIKKATNLSLTNKYINKDNNPCYQAEMEYVLYGNAKCQDNVKQAFENIFVLRGGLNLISGFQHFWYNPDDPTSSTIELIASNVSGLTAGAIPVPAIKLVLITGLSMLETVHDIKRLRAGFPVEIYKTEASDWQISLSATTVDLSSVKSVAGNKGAEDRSSSAEKGIFYSDYITLFLLSAMSGDKGDECTLRMADIIQQNMSKITNSEYDLSKSITYFQFKQKMRVDPMMMSLPLFSDYYNESSITNADWNTYEFKVVRGY